MPFFVLVGQIIISDIMGQATQILIAIPLTFGLNVFHLKKILFKIYF